MPIPSSLIDTSSRPGSPLRASAWIVPDLGGGECIFDRVRDQFGQDNAKGKGRVRLDQDAALGTHVEPDATIVLRDRSQGLTEVRAEL